MPDYRVFTAKPAFLYISPLIRGIVQCKHFKQDAETFHKYFTLGTSKKYFTVDFSEIFQTLDFPGKYQSVYKWTG